MLPILNIWWKSPNNHESNNSYYTFISCNSLFYLTTYLHERYCRLQIQSTCRYTSFSIFILGCWNSPWFIISNEFSAVKVFYHSLIVKYIINKFIYINISTTLHIKVNIRLGSYISLFSYTNPRHEIRKNLFYMFDFEKYVI